MRVRAISTVALLFVLLGVAYGCDHGGEGEAVNQQALAEFEGVIVALGDSLTAGYGVKEKEAYPYRLEKKLIEAGCRCRVLNAGISGERSDETIGRLGHILRLNPSIVILEIGVNDGFIGLEPRQVQRNIEEIIHILREREVTVVLAGMRMFDNARLEYNRQFAAIYPAVAKSEGVILIPHFLEGVAGDPTLNRMDGIHPTHKGYRIVAETVFPYILQAIEAKKRR